MVGFHPLLSKMGLAGALRMFSERADVRRPDIAISPQYEMIIHTMVRGRVVEAHQNHKQL